MSVVLYLCYAAPEDADSAAFVAHLQSELERDYLNLTVCKYRLGEAPQKRVKNSNATHVILVTDNMAYADPLLMEDISYVLKIPRIKLIPIYWKTFELADVEKYFLEQRAAKGKGRSGAAFDWESYKTSVEEVERQIGSLNMLLFSDLLKKHDGLSEDEAKKRRERDFNRHFQRLAQAIRDEPTTYDFFISYSRRNAGIVNLIKRRLESQSDTAPEGFDIWFDMEEIRPAEPWWDAIERGIVASHTAIIFVSTNWLSSKVCTDEYKKTREFGKRIIVIEVPECLPSDFGCDWQPPDAEAGYRAWLVREKAEENKENRERSTEISSILHQLKDIDNDASIISHALMQAIQQSEANLGVNGELENPAAFSLYDAELEAIKRKISDRHASNLALAKMQTRLLVQYSDWRNRGTLLTWKELRQSVRWVNENLAVEVDSSGAFVSHVVKRHKELIQASRWWFIRRATALASGVSFILLLLFLIYLRGQNALAEQELEASRLLNRETNRALQTLAQLNMRTDYDVGPQARQPVYFANSMWIADNADGMLYRFPVSGKPPYEPLSLGSGLAAPQAYGDYLWAYTRSAPVLYRIDPATNTSVSLTLPVTVDMLVGEGRYLWALSTIGLRLIQIDAYADQPEIAREVRVPFNERTLIHGGGYIWTFDGSAGYIRRLHADTGEEAIFTGFDGLRRIIYAQGFLWAVVDGGLLRIDPVDGRILARSASPAAESVEFTPDAVYVAHNTQVTAFDPVTLTVLQHFPVTASVHRLYGTPLRLWVFTTDSAMRMFDTVSGELLAEHRFTGADDVALPVSDGSHLWITPVKQGASYVFNQRDGALYRHFQLCPEVSSPLFDGAQMWFTCPIEQRVVSMPAYTAYFQTKAPVNDMGQHQPILIDGKLWIIQEQTGRLLVYDTVQDELLADITLLPDLLPFVAAGDTLWTASTATGEIFRITPALFDPRNDAAYISRSATGRSISRLSVFSDYIWAFHNDPRRGAQMAIVSRETMQVSALNAGELGLGIWSAVEYRGDIWAVGSTTSEGFLVRMDASGRVLEQIDIPDTHYAAWNVVPIGDELWLNIVVPRVEEVVSILFGLLRDRETLGRLEGRQLFELRNYNLVSRTWGDERWWLAAPITNPVDAAPWLWFAVLGTPPAFTGVEVGSESGELAINVIDGTAEYFLDRCKIANPPQNPIYGLTSTPIRHGDFIYAGCHSESSEFIVYDIRTQQPVNRIVDLGMTPRRSISVDGMVWVAFEASDSLAVFDESSGRLLGQWHMDDAPGVPVVDNGFVWVYHAQADTLQRLTVLLPAGQ